MTRFNFDGIILGSEVLGLAIFKNKINYLCPNFINLLVIVIGIRYKLTLVSYMK